MPDQALTLKETAMAAVMADSIKPWCRAATRRSMSSTGQSSASASGGTRMLIEWLKIPRKTAPETPEDKALQQHV
jgi:hypothetical protein